MKLISNYIIKGNIFMNRSISTTMNTPILKFPLKPISMMKKSTRKSPKSPISLTDNAASRIQTLLNKRENAIGILLSTQTRGCNGLSWHIDYVTNVNEIPKNAEEVNDKGVKIIIHPRALMNVIGTEMDFQEDEISSKFVFNNPNAKSYCGCGESFNVQ